MWGRGGNSWALRSRFLRSLSYELLTVALFLDEYGKKRKQVWPEELIWEWNLVVRVKAWELSF